MDLMENELCFLINILINFSIILGKGFKNKI